MVTAHTTACDHRDCCAPCARQQRAEQLCGCATRLLSCVYSRLPLPPPLLSPPLIHSPRLPVSGHGVGALLSWDWGHQGSAYASEVDDRRVDDTHVGGGPDGAGPLHETVADRSGVDVMLAAMALVTAGLRKRGHTAHAVLRTPAAVTVLAFLCRRRQFSDLLADVKRAAGVTLSLLSSAFAVLTTAYAAERQQLDPYCPVDSTAACIADGVGDTGGVTSDALPWSGPRYHGIRPLICGADGDPGDTPLVATSHHAQGGVSWGAQGRSPSGGTTADVHIPVYPGTAAALPLHLLVLNAPAPASLPAALLGTHSLAPRLHGVAGADGWLAHVVLRAGPVLLAQSTVHAHTLRVDSGACSERTASSVAHPIARPPVPPLPPSLLTQVPRRRAPPWTTSLPRWSAHPPPTPPSPRM